MNRTLGAIWVIVLFSLGPIVVSATEYESGLASYNISPASPYDTFGTAYTSDFDETVFQTEISSSNDFKHTTALPTFSLTMSPNLLTNVEKMENTMSLIDLETSIIQQSEISQLGINPSITVDITPSITDSQMEGSEIYFFSQPYTRNMAKLSYSIADSYSSAKFQSTSSIPFPYDAFDSSNIDDTMPPMDITTRVEFSLQSISTDFSSVATGTDQLLTSEFIHFSSIDDRISINTGSPIFSSLMKSEDNFTPTITPFSTDSEPLFTRTLFLENSFSVISSSSQETRFTIVSLDDELLTKTLIPTPTAIIENMITNSVTFSDVVNSLTISSTMSSVQITESSPSTLDMPSLLDLPSSDFFLISQTIITPSATTSMNVPSDSVINSSSTSIMSFDTAFMETVILNSSIYSFLNDLSISTFTTSSIDFTDSDLKLLSTSLLIPSSGQNDLNDLSSSEFLMPTMILTSSPFISTTEVDLTNSLSSTFIVESLLFISSEIDLVSEFTTSVILPSTSINFAPITPNTIQTNSLTSSFNVFPSFPSSAFSSLSIDSSIESNTAFISDFLMTTISSEISEFTASVILPSTSSDFSLVTTGTIQSITSSFADEFNISLSSLVPTFSSIDVDSSTVLDTALISDIMSATLSEISELSTSPIPPNTSADFLSSVNTNERFTVSPSSLVLSTSQLGSFSVMTSISLTDNMLITESSSLIVSLSLSSIDTFSSSHFMTPIFTVSSDIASFLSVPTSTIVVSSSIIGVTSSLSQITSSSFTSMPKVISPTLSVNFIPINSSLLITSMSPNLSTSSLETTPIITPSTLLGDVSQFPINSSVLTTSISPNLSTSSLETTPIIIPSPTLLGDLSQFLVRLLIRASPQQYEDLRNSDTQARQSLETAIGNAYVQSLRNLGAGRRRQLAEAKIQDVGERNSDTGSVPVDFYISAGGNPIESSFVVDVLTRNQPSQIGVYEVIDISAQSSLNNEESELVPSSLIIPLSVTGGALILITVCIVLTVIGFKLKNRRKPVISSSYIDSVSIDVEALSYHPKESIAIQHGTPTIEKLTRRSKSTTSWKRNSTLALLASSSSGQTDAWQNSQLGKAEQDETPAALFQRVAHYSDFQPIMPPPSKPFKMKLHSATVAPSPSTSNQSKTSLVSDADGNKVTQHALHNENKPTDSLASRMKSRERVKLHSRKVTSRAKSREDEATVISNMVAAKKDIEADVGLLGDVEQSSHSDIGTEGRLTTHTNRPSTRRRNARRKMNSRGYPIGHVTTDGYDTTDHKTRVPPSRQSRKHRSGRSMRGRPLTQGHQFSTGSLTRKEEYDSRRELAWMSTEAGMQLVTIQPLENHPAVQSQIKPTSWQPLPQLPPVVTNQAYSHEQLEQLLKIHKELEKVEKGLQNQKTSINSTDAQNLNSSFSYSGEQLSVNNNTDHSIIDHQRNLLSQPYFQQSMPMGQLLWSPQAGSQAIHTQPLSPYQLSHLRSTTVNPTLEYSQQNFHPFGVPKYL